MGRSGCCGRGSRSIGAVVIALVVSLATLSGCGSTARSSQQTSEAVCQAVLVLHGRSYFGSLVRKPFAPGRALGRAAVPPCQDTVVNGRPGPASGGGAVPVVSIAGIDPADAIAYPTDTHTIYVARPRHPPAAVRALVDDPRCSTGPRVTLTGSGQLEVVSAIPHRVLLDVQHADAAGARYLRWFVTLHVTAHTTVASGALAAMRGSGPGTITAVVSCRGGRFVADTMRAGA